MRFTIFALLTSVFVAGAQQHPPVARELRNQPDDLAPFVASPQPVVDRMLEVADIKPGEMVFDLGCGDGRILITAARKYNAKGYGVELSSRLVGMANNLVRSFNLEDQITIEKGHLLDVDLSSADVVTLYLETGSNELLRPNLEKFLKRGARVVSHDFEIRGWTPAKVEKIHAYNRHHVIYLYVVPAAFKPAKKK
jgi:SAM-dependent methyltransferase